MKQSQITENDLMYKKGNICWKEIYFVWSMVEIIHNIEKKNFTAKLMLVYYFLHKIVFTIKEISAASRGWRKVNRNVVFYANLKLVFKTKCF